MIAGAAASLLLVSAGIWAYSSPYTYVSMDVNPSIEFTVNRFNRVIAVKAVNDDGTEILQELSASDITNASIKTAIINVLEQITEKGYFDGDVKGGVVIATSGQNMKIAGELAKELQQVIELNTVENGDNVEVESFSVDQASVKEATKMGVTPGKLKLVRILKDDARGITEINEKDWLSRPVKDIFAAIGLYINTSEANVSNDVTSEDIMEGDVEDSLLFSEQSEDDDADEVKVQSEDADDDEDQNNVAVADKVQYNDSDAVKVQGEDADDDEDQDNSVEENEYKNNYDVDENEGTNDNDIDEDESINDNDVDEDANNDDNDKYIISKDDTDYDDDEDQDNRWYTTKDSDENDDEGSGNELGED
jgi:hypothetical protein